MKMFSSLVSVRSIHQSHTSEYYDKPLLPEKKLLLAMLDRAIIDYHSFYGTPETKERIQGLQHRSRCGRICQASSHVAKSARSWIHSNDTAPYSFFWVCDHVFERPHMMKAKIRRFCSTHSSAPSHATPIRNPRLHANSTKDFSLA